MKAYYLKYRNATDTWYKRLYCSSKAIADAKGLDAAFWAKLVYLGCTTKRPKDYDETKHGY